MVDITQVSNFPWEPQSFVTGNLAIGGAYNSLREWLQDSHGLHAETLLTAAGALAGYAGQNAALLRGELVTLQQGHVPKDAIILAEIAGGGLSLFGEWISQSLFKSDFNMALFSLAAAQAIRNGANLNMLPTGSELFATVSSSLGPSFGKLIISADHQPRFQPQEVLKLLWRPLSTGLKRPPHDEISKREPPLEQAHWPIILSIVAGKFIALTKDTLNPQIAYSIIMQAAMIGCTIYPEKIEPGKWQFTTSNGNLAVARGPAFDQA